jgi:hypothetical protein
MRSFLQAVVPRPSVNLPMCVSRARWFTAAADAGESKAGETHEVYSNKVDRLFVSMDLKARYNRTKGEGEPMVMKLGMPQLVATEVRHPRSDRILSGRKENDVGFLVNNFTAPALAAALRDREETLFVCAKLLSGACQTNLRVLPLI